MVAFKKALQQESVKPESDQRPAHWQIKQLPTAKFMKMWSLITICTELQKSMYFCLTHLHRCIYWMKIIYFMCTNSSKTKFGVFGARARGCLHSWHLTWPASMEFLALRSVLNSRVRECPPQPSRGLGYQETFSEENTLQRVRCTVFSQRHQLISFSVAFLWDCGWCKCLDVSSCSCAVCWW